jgi:pSer/pThr/pTyr-binding forkhead associated (FHA) protein
MVYEPGQASPRRVPVEPGLTLGRHPQCGLVLADGTVSGRHARVGGQPSALVIEDLGGTNPTHVNGTALQQGQSVPIRAGSTLMMGQTRIDVVAESSAADTANGGGAATLVGGSGEATVVGGDATVAAGGGLAPPPPSAAKPPPPPPPRATPPPPLDGDATMAAGTPPPPPPPPPPVQQAPAPPTPPAPRPQPQPIAHEVAPEAIPAAAVPAGEIPGGGAGDGGMATLVYGDDTNFDPNDPHQVLALQASLSVARPRLVFASEADRRIVDIGSASFVVGRSSEVACTVAHPGVSSKHARILFKKDRFFLEDLGGRNKTFLNKKQLAKGAAEELAPESHVSFGPVDALFVVDTDPEGHRIAADKYRFALDVLVAEGLVQPSQRSTAEAQAKAENRHVGEVLLKSEVISIKQWKDAFERGGVLFLTKGPKKADVKLPDKKLLILGGAVLVLLIVVLILVL